ncbi:1-aminocyclopropane-1-carboxylate synthase [Annulohypoxylon maeteangense]|uniref:1-aminocyclopropane-1-carboxylate synthase n=1 Tax=Annulohypoxylon maeteangense TaxID=1927788 RepID=UPI00200803DB|nr:1-aminocyclopropane-1-carboxylate synthase [Annulohypoxylon maeteangense]KAI0886469.1 1-aminocyclopropane-1-carboxylate synthase [Annulohypoxylon maeteangense]
MLAPSHYGLSKRGWDNVEAVMPKIKAAVAQRKIQNNTNIDLSTAENWLMRPELIEICKTAILEQLDARHFSYPRGFAGDPDLLDAFAGFFNTYFSPAVPVLPSHLATAPGAASCIDALLYNICEPGDGILMPGMYWNGFDFTMRVRPQVTPISVVLPSLTSTFSSTELIPALETAYRSSQHPIRALMITNPHNPLAICYPKDVLADCLRFCAKHNLHFISDEVYALTTFHTPDLPSPTPFTSVLSLDLDAIGAAKNRVHVVWSTSKDFGQSGLRLGCTISQANEEMVVALALAANTMVSALSAVFVTRLLTAPELPSLIKMNSNRLGRAYGVLTGFFREFGVAYVPCNAGLYLFARLAGEVKTWEEEESVVERLKGAGVLVSAGKAYHGPEGEKGWMRVGFAVPEEELREAMRRMAGLGASKLTTA